MKFRFSYKSNSSGFFVASKVGDEDGRLVGLVGVKVGIAVGFNVGRTVGMREGRLVGLQNECDVYVIAERNALYSIIELTSEWDLWVLETERLLGLMVGMSAENWAVLWVETKAVDWDVG